MDDVLTQEERNRYMREWSFYLSSMIGKIKSDEMLSDLICSMAADTLRFQTMLSDGTTVVETEPD